MFLWGKRAKNALVVGLMLSLMAPLLLGGLSFVYHRHCNRHAIRKLLKANFDDSELTFFKFAKAEISEIVDWKEADEEFMYKGEMYDVVGTETKGDSIFYRCWKDAKDTKLYCELNQLTVTLLAQDTPLQNQQNQFISFIKNFYCTNLASLKLTDSYKEIQASLFNYINHYISLNIRPLSPPPKGI